jgi:hypothetical protein
MSAAILLQIERKIDFDLNEYERLATDSDQAQQ